MQRTWTSSVTRGAQALSHQNVHTYITLHYNTVHYIQIHFSIFSNYLIALKYCLYINRRKNVNHMFQDWHKSLVIMVLRVVHAALKEIKHSF